MANLKDILDKPLSFSRVVPITPVRVGVLVESTLIAGKAKISALEAGPHGVMVTADGARVLIPWANVASADVA